jgi:anti-anti-sigma factor
VHRITLESGEHPAILRASGELDAFVLPDLQAAFDALGATAAVVFDLSAVTFLDSTALGLVVRAVREIAERGGQARVVLPASSARRIFEITTLDRVLPVAESAVEARAALVPHPSSS